MRDSTPRFLLIWLIISAVQFGLAACATGGATVNHHFSFDTKWDSSGVEVLDYQYGSSGQFGTHPEKERVALGETFPGNNIYGAMQRGDFLYVKWRIKQTGQIYQDKVDLQPRLPADIKDLRIHFVIKGPQLYVYLIWPFDGHQYPPGDLNRYVGQKRVQIYPDQPK